MMKSIRTLVRQDREKYVIPRRVQDVIPIQKIWEDGIFLTGGRYAKTFRFTDINYQVASEPDKEKMFRGYSALINSLDCGATTKITIFNHKMSQINFEKSILMPMQWDGLDDYREEYNQMLLDKATNGNGIVQEKFLTVSVRKKDVDAARSFFARVEADLSSHFAALGSTCGPMNAMERLQILHRFYRRGEENEFRFSLRDSARKGHSFRDYICPDSMERHSDYLQIGKRYARVLYLKDYASYIQDDFVSEFCCLRKLFRKSCQRFSILCLWSADLWPLHPSGVSMAGLERFWTMWKTRRKLPPFPPATATFPMSLTMPSSSARPAKPKCGTVRKLFSGLCPVSTATPTLREWRCRR